MDNIERNMDSCYKLYACMFSPAQRAVRGTRQVIWLDVLCDGGRRGIVSIVTFVGSIGFVNNTPQMFSPARPQDEEFARFMDAIAGSE